MLIPGARPSYSRAREKQRPLWSPSELSDLSRNPALWLVSNSFNCRRERLGMIARSSRSRPESSPNITSVIQRAVGLKNKMPTPTISAISNGPKPPPLAPGSPQMLKCECTTT